MGVVSFPSGSGSTESVSVCQVNEGVTPLRLLLVEDNPGDALWLQGTLDDRHPGQYAVTIATTLGKAKELLFRQSFDAILLDLSLPDSQGLETINRATAAAPDLPIIVLTGVADEGIAMQTVRCGAQDYLVKSQADATIIARAIRYAIDRKRAEEALRAQRRELEAKNEELQKAQRHLEAYRDRYIDLYDFAPLGYVTLDEDGYIQEINLAGAQLLNTDRDALTGYPFSEYVAKEDVPVLLDHLRKCVDEHCEVTSELRLAAKGGRLITAQLHSVPVEGSEKDVTFYKTAITDITQRKEMEAAILQSRAFLQKVIDGIPDTVLVIGHDHRIFLANRAAREMGGEIDPTACRTCYQFSHHRDVPCAGQEEPCPLRQVIAAKAPTRVTHTHYDAMGNPFFVEITAAPVFDDAGEVTHVIEACRDITDRLRLERARRLTQFSVDRAAVAVFWLGSDARFVYANCKACQYLGYSLEDLLTLTVHDIDPNVPAEVWPKHWEELKQRGSFSFESQHRTKDGRLVPVEITVNYLEYAGKEYNCAFVQDITDRKQAEQALRNSAAELARSNNDLEQFASVASHDLQEPLRTVSGFVQLLQKKYGGRLDTEADQYMEYTVDGAKRMEILVKDLLAYARVGTRGGEPVSTDAGAAFQQALGNLQASIQEAAAEITHSELPTVRADPLQLAQLFQNLLGNALKVSRRSAAEDPPRRLPRARLLAVFGA